MKLQKIKVNLTHAQITWLLTLIFEEKEVIQILNNIGIVANQDIENTTSNETLANILSAALLNQPNIDELVGDHISQKAEPAISRVGYMLIDEIETFFKAPGPLIDSGELGAVLWALLIDSREDVNKHGYQLMSMVLDTKEEQKDETPHQHLKENFDKAQHTLQEIPDVHVDQLQATQHQADDQHKEIHRLQGNLDEIKTKQLETQKKNKRLELHCKYLIEENERLKRKITGFREKEEKLALLQKENQVLQQQATQFVETNESLETLQSENKTLIEKNEEISSKLNELNQFKASTESFMVELKLAEEAVFKENQALEHLKSDVQNHFELLEKSFEASKGALNNIRLTVSNLELPNTQTIADSKKKTTQERVGVFVDVQNMFYAAKDRFERRVDYIKLLDLIVGPRQLITAYAYIVQIPEIKQSNFISLLEHNGYTIRSKDLRLRGDGSAKGDWDVGIAVDVVAMLGMLDVVILASGDGDFCPLAELIKQQQKRIEVVAFEHNTSMDLQAMADQFFPIGEELLM